MAPAGSRPVDLFLILSTKNIIGLKIFRWAWSPCPLFLSRGCMGTWSVHVSMHPQGAQAKVNCDNMDTLRNNSDTATMTNNWVNLF